MTSVPSDAPQRIPSVTHHEVVRPMNLAQWIARQGRQRPDAPALAEGERLHATWAEWAQATASLGSTLRADHDLAEGDRVAIVMRNRPQ